MLEIFCMFKIETWPSNPVLRTVCSPVWAKEMKKYISLGKDMIKYIKDPDNGWIGLAAPQIGVTKRLIVVSLIQERDDKEDTPYQTIMMINPEILEFGPEKDIEEEWCLSLPGMRWNVQRPTSLKVKFIDGKGKEQTLVLRWLPARIIQHEVDHINGVLFIDKLVK